MAGCAKAGRQKNSAANKRYIAENHSQANKDKHIKRAKSQALTRITKNLRRQVLEGTGRKLRREAWMAGYAYPEKPAMSFKQYERHHAI